jgi:hypothetical protein
MSSGQAATRRPPGRLTWKRKLLFTLVLLLLCWLVAELLFRVIGFDFADPRRALAKVPPFYRIPTEPVGTYAYRRPAGLHWQGRPLKTQLRLQGYDDGDYDQELEVQVDYDQDGFRNAPEMDDWSMVFVGDSFTELGHLPVEQLFTSVVAAGSGRTVKNLGTSYTGPFTHLAYLEHFGIAPGTRDAVLVFFEGNDLDDLVGEEIRQVRATRPGYQHGNLLQTHVPQRSLTWALLDSLGNLSGSRKISAANATYQVDGQRRRVTVNYAPVEMQVGQQRWELMLQALDGWVELCREHELQPWFLYMPCKHRVLHPFLQMDADAHPILRSWQPGGLPGQLSRLCENRQVTFLDATSVLQRSAAEGRLPYNTVFDTHLNERGSRQVGEFFLEQLNEKGK